MNKLKKIFCLLITTLLFLTFSVCVFASNETSEDAIKIEISTDKAEYKVLGIAEITATITNTGNEPIENVTAQAVFNDLAPVKNSETSKSVDILKAEESISFTYNATLNKNEHDLNIFQKIFLWLVRLFNGGYTANNNSIDVVAQDVTEITFGKFTAKNVVQVEYDTIDIEDDNNNSDDSDITAIPTYEELIEDVNIDEVYEEDEEDISIDEDTGIKYINNIIIIVFDWECTDERKAEIINSINGKVVGGINGYNELHVEIEKSTLSEIEAIIDELNKNEDVSAEYDEIIDINFNTSSIIPNDPFINVEALNLINWNTDINDLNTNANNWWVLATEANRAWGYREYNANINIGIVDSGFDTNHDDYSIQVISKENSSDNHGTHVAGIIGAKHNNKKGIAGISINSNLYGYDIETSKEFKISEVLKGLDVLIEDYNCKIINFSLGYKTWYYDGYSYINKEKDPLTQKIFDERGKKASKRIGKLLEDGYDFVVVQAAGNGAENTGLGIDAYNSGFFCSITEDNCYNSKNVSKQEIMNRVIIVANANMPTQGTFELNMSSNGGSFVDIAAPGTWIYSTLAGIEDTNNLINAGQKYGQLSGTSMASPIVAGVASLVWSVNPNFNGAQVKEIVCSTAEDGGILVKDNPNSPTTGSFYLVNAKLAVEEAIKKTYWTCTVNGSVIDQNDEALANVNIVATDMDTNKKVVAQNNADGTFTLLLPCGTYSISFSKYDTEVVIELDKTTYNQEIDLEEILMIIPETTVSGTVKDKDTELPVSNVIIDVYNTESCEYGDGAETDANGYFEMEIPRDDSYTFTFYHDDYAEDYSMEVDAKTTPLDLGDIFLSKDGYEEDNRTITDSGTCGDNITWTLYEDGELVISGSGKMSSTPWNKEDIKSVIISDGVTSIIGNAFDRCSNLASVTIGNSITSIGDCAFRYCDNLTEIIIPDSVTTIGNSAFFSCKNLSSAIIGNGVTTIGQWAFSYCSSLECIELGQNLNIIYDDVFSDCSSLTEVYANDINSWLSISFTSDESNPMSYADNLYFNNVLAKDITIPNNISSIGDYAFYGCENITSISIPNSIITIGTQSFYKCSKLESLSIPDSVLSIEEGAFANCNNLTSVELSENLSSLECELFGWCYNLKEVTIPNNVSKIGDWAFYDCNSLSNIVIGDNVKTIGEKAFESTSITSIIIPDGITSIGNGAFYQCNSLLSISIGKDVSTLGDSPFVYCANLKEINVDENNEQYSSDTIGVLFNKDKTMLIQYPQGNENTEYEVPETVTTICSDAFDRCNNLITVTISNNVTSIGGFSGCDKLKTIILGNNISLIESKAFYSCDYLENIIMPKSIKEIGNMAFYYCMNLKDVYYEGTEEEWNAISIGDNAFYRGMGMYSTIHYNS